MFRRPAVLGIDSLSTKIKNAESLERKLQNFGSNTGNMLFSEALYSVIPNAKRLTYHYGIHDLDDCDAVVIAAANWVNSHSDFGGLAERLKASGLPVIISGLGVQLSEGESVPRLKEGTLSLLRLASETSNAISVRGDYSCEILSKMGIRNVQSTGCPSLLLAGQEPPDFDTTTEPFEQVVMHGTRHHANPPNDPFQKYLYKEAMRMGYDIVLQSELPDMAVSENVSDARLDDKVWQDILALAYGAEYPAVRHYLERHGKVFWDLRGWLDYLATKKFCIGSRVHGTIAALMVGTPAVLLAHDVRTLEMARRMALPYVESSQIDIGGDLRIGEFRENDAFERFASRYREYRLNFRSYFQNVGLGFDDTFRGLVPAASG